MKGDPGSFEPKVRQTLPDSQTIKVKAKPSQNEPLFRDNAIKGGEGKGGNSRFSPVDD